MHLVRTIAAVRGIFGHRAPHFVTVGVHDAAFLIEVV